MNTFDAYSKSRDLTDDIELDEWVQSHTVAQATPRLSLELSSEGAPQGQGTTPETPPVPPGNAPQGTPSPPGVTIPPGEVPGQPKPPGYPTTPTSAIRAGAAGEVTPAQVDAGKGVLGDIGAGLQEAPQQILGGARDAIVNMLDFVAQYSAPSVPGTSEPALLGGLIPAVTPEIEKADSVTGGIIRSVAQFLTAFIPANAITGPLAGVSAMGQSAVAGAIADVSAFDPKEPRLSNLIQQLPEAVQNPLTDYLAASPEDRDAEGRLKNVIEGLGLGLVTEGIIRAAKVMKNAALADESVALLKSEEGAITLPGGTPPSPAIEAAQASPGKFNPQRQASSKLHQLTAEINVAARESGLMETQTRGTVGFDEITTAARNLIKTGKMSAERLLSMEPGTILTAEEGTAARFIRDATLKRHDQLMTLAEMGDEGAKSQIVASTYLASRIEAATEAASGTEPARALASRRIASRAKGTSMGQMQELLRMIEEGPLTPEAETIIDRAARGIQTAVRKAAEGATGDEQALMTSVADQMQAVSESLPPGQVLGGLWDLMLKNAMQAQERPQSLALWTQTMQEVQDRITNAVPEGQLLGGLMDVMLGDIAHQEATVNPDLLLSYWRTLEGEKERQAFVKHYEHFSRTGSIVNALLEARSVGLLSFRSMQRNVLGSGIATIWAIPERALAAPIGLARQGVRAGLGLEFNPERVTMDESFSMIHGMWMSQRTALGVAAKAISTGESQVFPELSKFEYQKAISSEALKLTGHAGRAADVLGEIARAKFRGLVAGDDYFKWVNYKAEQYALATRDYHQRLATGATREEAEAAYERALTDPPDWLQKKAQEYSAYATFNDEVLNKWGRHLLEIRNDDGWESQVSRFLLPFAKAPMNVGGYAAERTPGINFASNHWWQEMRAGGARFDLAVSRLALGSAVFSVCAGLAGDGYLNGKGPKNPELRKQMQENGWAPYSINRPNEAPIPFRGVADKLRESLGENPLPFRGVAEPLGFILGACADFGEVLNSGASAPDLTKLAVATLVSNLNYLEEMGMLKGIHDVTEAIMDDSVDASKLLHTMFASAMPFPFMGELKMIQEQVDPGQREMRGPHGGVGYLGRELELLQDDIMSKIPGLSNNMYPKRDRLGRPMLRQGGWWTLAPSQPSAQEPHPYLTEINRQGIIIEGTPKTLTRGKKIGPLDEGTLDTAAVELGPGEWDRFRVLEGQEVKLYRHPEQRGGAFLNLDDYLRAYVQSKEYAKLSDGPNGTKATELRNIVREYREAAKAQLEKEFPALVKQMEEKEDLLDFEKMDKAEQARERPRLEKKYGRKINVGILR